MTDSLILIHVANEHSKAQAFSSQVKALQVAKSEGKIAEPETCMQRLGKG